LAPRARPKAITLVVATSCQSTEARTFLKFLLNIGRMKIIPRSGWISHGVSLPDVESVADHSYSTCVLSLLIADLENERGARVNVERVLRLAVFHDMAESLTFDISRAYLEYLGRRGGRIKAELERSASKHLIQNIKERRLSRLYLQLQAEFEANRTLESRIVHAADALDILLQVIEYRRRGYPETLLQELWTQTTERLGDVRIPSVTTIHRLIVKEAKNLKRRAK